MSRGEPDDAAWVELLPAQHYGFFRLDGCAGLVTGASSGLGRRFAEVLAAAGARVVVAARRTDRLEALAARGPTMTVVTADVSDDRDRERLVEQATEAVGPLDFLVNNAGFSVPAAIEAERIEDVRSMLETNLVSAWHLCKLAGSAMAERGSGAIVNIASIAGLVGGTPLKQAGYSASKAGLVNLTRELGLQWARRNVRVNALCPGYLDTEMTAGMRHDPRAHAFIERNCPMTRLGVPAELDGALLLLTSPANTFMTGSVITVDGGWTAR